MEYLYHYDLYNTGISLRLLVSRGVVYDSVIALVWNCGRATSGSGSKSTSPSA
jgi:hypothetical protein